MIRPLPIAIWTELTADAQRRLLQRPAVRDNRAIEQEAGEIIARAREGGVDALLSLTRELDKASIDALQVTDEEIQEAAASLDPQAIDAIDQAVANVTRFHQAQLAEDVRVETQPGVVCERISKPIQAAGLYVPAGSAPLPSTAIMLAVPAKLANCPVRVICTPARPDGKADPAVVVAATRCGVTAIFKLGGAQAIAAMAYGIGEIPKVDKIYGPGNAWVTAAKRLVSADPEGAALDMPAGPSEVMVIADGGAGAEPVALDLLAQSEHGPDSQALLVTTDSQLAAQVAEMATRIGSELPRQEIILKALENASVILVDDLEQAMDVANLYAPEHLILQVENPRDWLSRIQHAGSVFLGPWTPESVGDYCSGTNHVLPTYGYARAYSGLSVKDFQKQITVQELSRAGLTNLGPVVTTLARLENLEAHARSVEVRQEPES